MTPEMRFRHEWTTATADTRAGSRADQRYRSPGCSHPARKTAESRILPWPITGLTSRGPLLFLIFSDDRRDLSMLNSRRVRLLHPGADPAGPWCPCRDQRVVATNRTGHVHAGAEPWTQPRGEGFGGDHPGPGRDCDSPRLRRGIHGPAGAMFTEAGSWNFGWHSAGSSSSSR